MLRRARIEKIIAEETTAKYFTALVTWLDRDGGFYNQASLTAKIELSYSYISRSFGIQYKPVPGDVVLCGFCADDTPVIIAYLTTDYYSKMQKKNLFGYFFRNILEGEYAIKGLQGNELYLDRKGSLRFIARDQDITKQNLKTITTAVYNQDDYVKTLDTGIDLTKQILDATKTEVTIGKVYDEEYKEEQLLNGESISVQVIGNKNTATTEQEGNTEKINIETEQVFSLKINTEGEVELKRNDGTYSINISKDGEINISGISLKINASDIVLGDGGTEPGVKGTTLRQWCNTHTHPTATGTTGAASIPLPTSALSETVKLK